MPDFEDIIKVLIMAAGSIGALLGFGFGLKALLQKPPPDPQLHERLADAEQRLAELEERADFADRVITDLRDRPALPRE